ncbi:hypothetical protein MLD38_011927 [Melastoma candidum]|uniref:Uncharacterized protein n=1 Tax=Melastoma candidum TaxID=119954 RepID=A0ACB9R422_9MYRT|nr:hypothetical protein MLD38_011927 [Melastoma candidum]
MPKTQTSFPSSLPQATSSSSTPASSVFNLEVLDSLTDSDIQRLLHAYSAFCSSTDSLLLLSGIPSASPSPSLEFADSVHVLCSHRLRSFVVDHFLRSLQDAFEGNCSSKFWRSFEAYRDFPPLEDRSPSIDEASLEQLLCEALDEISAKKQHQEQCLSVLVSALESCDDQVLEGKHDFDTESKLLFSKYQLMVHSVLLASLPRHFYDILHWYFKRRLEEISAMMDDDCSGKDSMDLDESAVFSLESGDMDIDGEQRGKSLDGRWVTNIGKVVRDLRSLGFLSMTEDAYASAIFMLLNAKVNELAGDDFRCSILGAIKRWIQAVPLQLLHSLHSYLGDTPSYDTTSNVKSPLSSKSFSCYPGDRPLSQGIIIWKLRLEYFAYEVVQDLRIDKLFEIIVDYPESSPAIEDLKQCLEYTGQHSKLVQSFISSLRYRLLTAGASTNDILHQYVSTIKALRTIDRTGIFLEEVGEPIREYLRGRKDTIKCIVTMLTDGASGSANGSVNAGDSLLEELNRDEEGQEKADLEDGFNSDDKQAWASAMCWEPDPAEADPLKGSRNQRKVDILGMIVGIIGSKDQLVNEYRVILAEKLLNKTDYDIDPDIRTLELLKIHFGEGIMQKCEIMLNDLIDSKRTNSNIRASMNKASQPSVALENAEISSDVVDATIISSNFWPPIQDEEFNVPEPVDRMLTEYASRYTEVKTPRKLLWKKTVGTVKLELQFNDREIQLTVTPMQAAIIMQFQDQKSWSSKDLATAIGVPVDVLDRRINFWISKGILAESVEPKSSERAYTILEAAADAGTSGVNNDSGEEFVAGDEEEDGTVASVEDQLRKEMTVYEKYITGMLRNFGRMTLERIHNTLKMFCIADPIYDKSPHQLQLFLSGLISEEKLELTGEVYSLRKQDG